MMEAGFYMTMCGMGTYAVVVAASSSSIGHETAYSIHDDIWVGGMEVKGKRRSESCK